MSSFSCLVRKPAPSFTTKALVDGQIKALSNADFSDKYWVLMFYPLDFTFVCPTELIAFNDRVEEFKEIGCDVVAASVDSPYAHLAWSKMPRSEGGLGPLKIPIIGDVSRKIASSFGVLLEEEGVALRGLFIIDRLGVVRHSTINDLPIGRSVDEVLRTVKAIQFTDKHGEVCPANWKPGTPTIVPDPENSKKFFSQQNPLER